MSAAFKSYVKMKRGLKLKEEDALSGATFDGSHAVELGLADSPFSSVKASVAFFLKKPSSDLQFVNF